MHNIDIAKDYEISDFVRADGSVCVDFTPRSHGLIQDRPVNFVDPPRCELVVVSARLGERCIWQSEPPSNIEPTRFEAMAIARALKRRGMRPVRLAA
jgi:hypothetical protein